MLARHWPEEGSRNLAALALAGASERSQSVRATAKKLKNGDAITGFTKLKELFGAEVAGTAFKWLREANEIQDAVAWEEPILFEQLMPDDVPASLIPGPLGEFAKAVAAAQKCQRHSQSSPRWVCWR